MKKSETKKPTKAVKTPEEFDYKEAYEQQKARIKQLESKCELLDMMYSREMSLRFQMRDNYEERIGRLKTIVNLTKDSMRCMAYWNWWLFGKLSLLKRLFWKSTLIDMENEIHDTINKVEEHFNIE